MALEILGTCHHDCPDSCGWIATVDDGQLTNLRGNPEHPFSQGELCPKVNKLVDRVYSDDRILTPLVRTGPKGSGEYAPASWDDALAMVAERWHSIIDTHGGEAILPWWDAGTQGLLNESLLDKRLLSRMGATRRIGSLCGETTGWGTFATLGTPHGAEPTNVRHGKFVILWGTNTLLTNRHLWPFVEEARANGAEIVVIDPFRTVTAERADWFIQPLPGTDIALMLAMMHVLIRDDMIDHDYVAAHTTGYDELVAHVADWTPERAAEECGLEAADIERLAQSYGAAEPAFIRTLIGPEHRGNGGMFYRTLNCLPLLTGSWRHLGGGIARSIGSVSARHIDGAQMDRPGLANGAERRSYNMNHLGRMLTDETLDTPVKSLLVWCGNPLVTVPGAGMTRKGLERDDLFTVVSEQFMTDTASYADVIFPATTQLEQFDVVPSWGWVGVGWNEAAIDPRGESVPNTELFRRLAGAMGYTEPELFASDEELLAETCSDLDIDEMREKGWTRAGIEDDHLPYADGGFGFDGKAEFVSSMLPDQGLPALPTYTPVSDTGAGDGRPLMLHTPKFHQRFLNSSYSASPGHGDRESGPFCEIDEVDAASRGIADGDRVRVFNDRGALEVPARISNRVRPGLVSVPFGWWGSQIDGDEGSMGVNSLTNDDLTDFGGGVAYNDTLVEVALA